MKSIYFFVSFVLVCLLFSSCNLQSLLSKVEVNYDVDFDPKDQTEATVIYYNQKGELISEIIPAGEWSYKGIFDDGAITGVWVESDAQSGYLSIDLIIWYSELNDFDDYVDANTWVLPLNGKVGFQSGVERIKKYPVTYTVTVEGTNGVPVDIMYSDEDYDSQSLLSEASKINGLWQYEGNFPIGGYASITASSVATSGTATIVIAIDYDTKADVSDTMVIDFSTATKTGSLGFPVE